MASLNQCNFIGNLGKDPEMRFMANGKAVTNFSIAVTEKWNADGEQHERTEWVRCTAYGSLAEVCQKYLARGKQVFVSGKFHTSKWTDKDGNDRYSTDIIIGNMVMLGGNRNNDQAGQDQNNDSQPTGSPEFDDIPF